MADLKLRFGKDMIVIDACMQTTLKQQEIDAEFCAMLLNVIEPELIQDIHRRSVIAGCNAVRTNSFSGNRDQLSKFALVENLADLNRASVKLAKLAKAQHVLANLAPVGFSAEKPGSPDYDLAKDIFAEQAKALANENPDAIFIEQMGSLDNSLCAIAAAREVCDLPIICIFDFCSSGNFDLDLENLCAAAKKMEAQGADVIGISCSNNTFELLKLISGLVQVASRPIAIILNTDDANCGILESEAMAAKLSSMQAKTKQSIDNFANTAFELYKLGVQFIGSGLNTSIVHTGAIYSAIADRFVI